MSDILGFDLGDGESALALCGVEGDSEPDVLRVVAGQPSFLTCFAKDASGRIYIGEQAIEASDLLTLHLTFKRSPGSDDGTAQRLASEFFGEVMRRAEKAGCTLTDTRIIVGHPSAWTDAEVAAYTQSLTGGNSWYVKGVSESRAAFLQLKESARLPVARLRTATLIVDIGSSTTDFTLVKDLAQLPTEFGHNALGGRLIDRAILAYLLEGHSNRNIINEVLNENPHIRAQCEHLCRRLKENFFLHENEYRISGDAAVVKQFVDIDDEIIFRGKLTAQALDAVLEQSQADLDGMGWKKAYLKTLQQVRSDCERAGQIPETIAMTGGGSRIAFTHEIAREVFPDAEIISDPTPEFSIVKGLARAGRWDIRSESFLRELDPLADFISQHLEKESDTFVNLVAGGLTDSFEVNVVQRGMLDWRDGIVGTLEELGDHVNQLGSEWAGSDRAGEIIQNAVEKWLETVEPGVAPKLHELTHRYGLPGGTLRLDVFDVNIKSVNLDSKIFQDGEGLSTVSTAVGGVAGGFAGLLAFKVTGIVTLALLNAKLIVAGASGPPGWLIALISGAIFWAIGKEKAEEVIKKNNIPRVTRPYILTDKAMIKAVQNARPEIYNNIKEALITEAQGQIVPTVSRYVRSELQQKMNSALVLISR